MATLVNYFIFSKRVRWCPLDRDRTVPRAELTEMADSREREMAGWTVPAPQRVVFCNNCGTLMEEPTFANTNVLCRMCGTVTPSKGAALAKPHNQLARVSSTDPPASAQYLRSSW